MILARLEKQQKDPKNTQKWSTLSDKKSLRRKKKFV